MKRRTILGTVIGFVAAIGVIGGSVEIVTTAEAGPPVSDGMANRYFQIQVTQTTGPDLGVPRGPRPNCYSFEGDGTWIDPLFPDPSAPEFGTWEDADGPGAITRYTAEAFAFDGFLFLEQVGQVTPSFAEGQTRLKAISTLYVFDFDAEGYVALATFVSTGYETDGCS